MRIQHHAVNSARPIVRDPAFRDIYVDMLERLLAWRARHLDQSLALCDLTDEGYMSTLSDKEIADVIKMGGAIKGRPLMPSHPQIVGNDMESLVAYIRTLSGTKSK